MQRNDDFIRGLGVVILAAGYSRRMGQPKLLLPWKRGTILEHLLHQFAQLQPQQVALVLRPDDDPLKNTLDRIQFPEQHRIWNQDAERGMFSSIRCAAAWPGWNAGLTHWAVSLGDQPHVKSETLSALARFAAAHPECISQPICGGHGRHPVILPRRWFHAISTCTQATLKEFLKSNCAALAQCPLDDPGLNIDLDTPEDYERARRECGSDSPFTSPGSALD